MNGGNPNAPLRSSRRNGLANSTACRRHSAWLDANLSLPQAVANAQPRPVQAAQADAGDDGEEDKPAAGAQMAQGAVPAVCPLLCLRRRGQTRSQITPAIAVQMIQSGNPGQGAWRNGAEAF